VRLRLRSGKPRFHNLYNSGKVFFASNINEAWSSFKDIFTNILDTVAPLKDIRVKQRTEP
jgi:hypothetical protein